MNKFNYFIDICDAIDETTAALESKYPGLFYYKKANLRYALERNLYFSLVLNEYAYNLYISFKQNRPIDKVNTKNLIEKQVIETLIKATPMSSPEFNRRISFKDGLKRVKGTLVNNLSFLNISLGIKNRLKSKRYQKRIMIYVSSEKFVRYLMPIIKELAESYCFLLLDGNKIEQYLQEHKLPYIKLTDYKKYYKLKDPNPLRQEMMDLFQLYDCFYNNIKLLKPTKIVLVEGNAPWDEVLNQIGKKLHTPVICLQQGWSPVIHNGFRNMSFTKMLVWGQGFAELLRPYNPKQEFQVVGSHIVPSEYQDNVYGQSISFFLQMPGPLITLKDWDLMITLILWTADKYNNSKVLVREHPNYQIPDIDMHKLKKMQNVFFVSADKFSLEDVYKRSKIAISVYSSTILESIAFGVLPIIFNTTDMPNYSPDIHKLGAGLEVKSLEEAKSKIMKLMEDPEYLSSFFPMMNKVREHFFYRNGQNISRSIVKVIEDIC